MASRPPGSSLLRSHRTFRQYWLARACSLVGDGVVTISLVLYVQQTTGSGAAVGGLLLAQGLPRLLGPVAGAIADRSDQRKLMIGCDLGQCVIYAFIAALLPGYGLLLALVAAASLLQTVFSPAGRAALPAMVLPDELGRANVLLGTATNLKVAGGPFLGGVLVAVAGVGPAVAVNSATFLVSALILTATEAFPSSESASSSRGVLAASSDGVRFVFADSTARRLAALIGACSFFLAVDGVALVFLIRETLQGGSSEYGVASAVFGLGMIGTSLFLAVQPARLPTASVSLIAAVALGGVGTLATGLAPTLVLVLAAQAVAGVGNGLENIATDTLVQRLVPRDMLGRFFGVITTLTFGAISLSSAAAGIAIDVAGARAVFVVAGAGAIVSAAVFGFPLWKGEARATTPGVVRPPRA